MKNIYKIIIVFLFFAGCFCLIVGCGQTGSEQITIKGSTTMAPLMEVLSKSYTKDKDIIINVKAVGSLEGIRALIKKECMIACSSVPVPAALMDEADQNNVQLKEFSLCRDSIIPIVNVSNPVNRLSMDQLKELFTGRIENWNDLGGIDAPVKIVLRKKTSGTHQVWSERVASGLPLADTSIRVSSNSGVLAAVAEGKNAVGYISSTYLNNEVKKLDITDNKIFISIERPLFLYVDTKCFTRETKKFISYLYSEPAKQIILDSGFTPGPRTKPPETNL